MSIPTPSSIDGYPREQYFFFLPPVLVFSSENHSIKSLLLSKCNQLDVVDVPAPAAAADEIIIGVKACGICGRDVRGYD